MLLVEVLSHLATGAFHRFLPRHDNAANQLVHLAVLSNTVTKRRQLVRAENMIKDKAESLVKHLVLVISAWRAP